MGVRLCPLYDATLASQGGLRAVPGHSLGRFFWLSSVLSESMYDMGVFAASWVTIWWPKGVKLSSVRLVGSVENLANSDVLVTCHLFV